MSTPAHRLIRGIAATLVVTASMGVPFNPTVRAIGSCLFAPRIGKITFTGTQVSFRADAQGVLRWRQWSTSDPWSSCVGAGKTATLASTNLIDIQLTKPEFSWELLALDLGTAGSAEEPDNTSGLEHETIHVKAISVSVDVIASDNPSHIVIGASTIDLDGDGTANLTIDSVEPHHLLIAGGAAADILDGTYSDAKHLGMAGYGAKDVLFGSSGDDSLMGGPGDDFIAGGDGDDGLAGEDGDDFLYGEGGHDGLDGGPGRDQLFGGNGNADHCWVDLDDSVISSCELIG